MNEHSRPQPDVAVLKWRDDLYYSAPPVAHDVLLVIEVADTSLAGDRGRKLGRYAGAGIPEYWIVNLQARVVEVYSGVQADAARYTTERTAYGGETLTLPAGLEGAISVDAIFGIFGESPSQAT